MQIATSIAIYFLIWWIVLFAVLPWGVRSQGQEGAEGARVLGDGNPKLGAHDKPVLFLHPKDFCGTLVELEQA